MAILFCLVLFLFPPCQTMDDYTYISSVYFQIDYPQEKKKVVEIEIGGPMMVHNLLSLLKRDSKLLWKGHKTKDKKKGGGGGSNFNSLPL